MHAWPQLFPPRINAQVLKLHSDFQTGAEFVLRMGLGYWYVQLHARLADVQSCTEFSTVQVNGPFADFSHRVCFEGIESDKTRMSETVEYRLRRGAIGRMLDGGFVRWQIRSMLAYRGIRLTELLCK